MVQVRMEDKKVVTFASSIAPDRPEALAPDQKPSMLPFKRLNEDLGIAEELKELSISQNLETDHMLDAGLDELFSEENLNNPFSESFSEERLQEDESQLYAQAEGNTWLNGGICNFIPGRLSFAIRTEDEYVLERYKILGPRLYFFSSALEMRYRPLCADFGPVDAGIVIRFCEYMKQKLEDQRLEGKHLVYVTEKNPDAATNAAFLLCAFMVLVCGWSPQDAFACLESMQPYPFKRFRDATYQQNYKISILDCLSGLKKAEDLGWISMNNFDLDEYDTNGNILNGHLHQLCSKIVAHRAPIMDAEPSSKRSPAAYAETYRRKGVTGVVSLCDEIDHEMENEFDSLGFACYHLPFENCTVPTNEIVQRFLDICDSEEGLVAIYSANGLGRTGTMAALWMMRKCHFRADEVIGWVRIVRPWSIIGPQQHFLKACQGRIWHHDNSLGAGEDQEELRKAWCMQSSAGTMAEDLGTALGRSQSNSFTIHHDRSTKRGDFSSRAFQKSFHGFSARRNSLVGSNNGRRGSLGLVQPSMSKKGSEFQLLRDHIHSSLRKFVNPLSPLSPEEQLATWNPARCYSDSSQAIELLPESEPDPLVGRTRSY